MGLATKERQCQRNRTNAIEPNGMAVAAMKQGETEMKTIFPK
jgi:hypothetical protein